MADAVNLDLQSILEYFNYFLMRKKIDNSIDFLRGCEKKKCFHFCLVSYAKRKKIRKKGLKQLSDPPERIVVEMVGGSDPLGR